MNTFQRRQTAQSGWVKPISLLAIICCGYVTLTPENAYAQNSRRENGRSEQAIEGRQFNHKIGVMVLGAQKLMAEEKYMPAALELQRALNHPKLTPYERGVIYQLLGSCHYEDKQYAEAINAFESAINSGGLLVEEISSLRVNIAQLLIANSQAARGAKMLEDWVSDGGELNRQYLEMLWQAWSRVEQYDRALPWAERWFNEASPKERKHYDILNFLYNHLQMPTKQADIVKQMINRWPEDKQLWDAWASLLAGSGQEEDAFAVRKILYLNGTYTTENELSMVVQYYSFYEMPYQAAQILELEMNAGRITQTPDKLVQLANLFRQAREYGRATPVLELAAKAAGTGKVYADLGEALYKEGQCSKSEAAFLKAMELGYNQGKSWMLIAACHYDASADDERVTCDMTDAQKQLAPWVVKRKQAMAAYESVPEGSRESENANVWNKFIKAETTAIQRQCRRKKDIRLDLCNLDIKQAYMNMIFVGEFVLQDETCMVHKPAYDVQYRRSG